MTRIERFLNSRIFQNPVKLSASPSTYDERGYYNWFGGFHRFTDRRAYSGLLLLVLQRPWKTSHWSVAGRFMWRRWIHRSCDTTDFHHDIYCELDPWVRKRERERQYVEVWKGKWHDAGYKLVIGYRHFEGVPLCPCRDPGNYFMLEQSETDPLDVIFTCWCGRTAKARMDSLVELNQFLIKNNVQNEEIL